MSFVEKMATKKGAEDLANVNARINKRLKDETDQALKLMHCTWVEFIETACKTLLAEQNQKKQP